LAPQEPVYFDKTGFEWINRRGFFEIWRSPWQSETTSDESVVNALCTVTKLDDFDFTVTVAQKLWRVKYSALSFTPYVYLQR
jgi:hypothetical protein